MKIPYTILPSNTPFGKSFDSKTPMIIIEFDNFFINCLIDSDAIISMMPGDFGEALGLKVDKGEPFLITGVDGIAIPTYIHEIECGINGIKYKMEGAFSYNSIFPSG